MSESNAPGIQTMLGAAGACPQIRFGGRAYTLGHPTQAAKSRLEELAADTAIQRVEEREGSVKPATFRKMLDRVTDRVIAGDYKTWREGWQEVVWGDGGALFALSLFREHHPEMTLAEVSALTERCGRQYAAALARVLPNFLDFLLSGREDVTPEQAGAVRAAVAAFVAKLEAAGRPAGEPTPPESPTPAST